MSRDVVTATHTTSLEAVANQQLQHGVGSVIITNDSAPYGIITETDIVHAASRSGKPLEQVPTHRVAGQPLQTINPDRTGRLAVKRMQDEDVKEHITRNRRERRKFTVK